MSQHLEQTEVLFYQDTGLEPDAVQAEVGKTLSGLDDGELFLEYNVSENLTFDDGHLRNASTDKSCGFGLRAVHGEQSAYAHSTELNMGALKRAAGTVSTIRQGYDGNAGSVILSGGASANALYSDVNPMEKVAFSGKVELVEKVDSYIRQKDNRVKQVSVSLGGEWQAIEIVRGEERVADIRPLVRMNISVVVQQNGRMERGSYGFGGRYSYDKFFDEAEWKKAADDALRQALTNLDSVPVKAGEMDVVLGPGWPGVLLHEAVGHGLEGDFNRKKTSAFSGLIGERVAAKGVTVVDDGTIPERRGSLSVDDEGTPTNYNVLIEDGILKGYMQDRMNARLMGMEPTGNGRRESFECQPMPRMTNTYMLAGDQTREELIGRVKDGIYAVNFGGGQVDITSGKFVFSASEAYRIENGVVKEPVKGVTLIGNGPDCLMRVAGIGNDLELDHGIGTCGKDGQGVPCGVGQPSMLINKMTVGGTEV